MPDAGHRDAPGVLAPPPLLFVAFAVLAAALDRLVPLGFLPPFAAIGWTSWAGGGLALAGIVSGLAGIFSFRRAGTNISPHLPALRLATGGIYRVTRNPMYLGLLLLFAGASLGFSAEWGVILLPLFALVLHHGVVKREEAYLEAKFGDPYRAFLLRTRRWL